MVRSHSLQRLVEIITEEGPRVAIASASHRLFKFKTRVKVEQWYRYGRYHVAELDPYRIIWIDPSMVYQRNSIPITKSDYHLAHVLDGNWDLQRISFEKRMFYRSLEQHFRHAIPWDETELYRSVMRGEKRWRGISSGAELDERCAYLDQLYCSIQKHGFKTQRALRSIPPRTPREIKIMIGRDGTYFYLNGKHRLAIAKLLDLDRIPVNIAVRHAEWQALRDEIARHESGYGVSDDGKFEAGHPDLSYLLS